MCPCPSPALRPILSLPLHGRLLISTLALYPQPCPRSLPNTAVSKATIKLLISTFAPVYVTLGLIAFWVCLFLFRLYKRRTCNRVHACATCTPPAPDPDLPGPHHEAPAAARLHSASTAHVGSQHGSAGESEEGGGVRGGRGGSEEGGGQGGAGNVDRGTLSAEASALPRTPLQETLEMIRQRSILTIITCGYAVFVHISICVHVGVHVGVYVCMFMCVDMPVGT